MITRNSVTINMTSKRSEIAIAIKIQLNINSSGFSGYFIILIFDFYVWGLIFMFSVFYYRNYITNKIRLFGG
jgi:hypothetical protein